MTKACAVDRALAEEAIKLLAAGQIARAGDLYGDGAVKQGVAGLVHRAERASPLPTVIDQARTGRASCPGPSRRGTPSIRSPAEGRAAQDTADLAHGGQRGQFDRVLTVRALDVDPVVQPHEVRRAPAHAARPGRNSQGSGPGWPAWSSARSRWTAEAPQCVSPPHRLVEQGCDRLIAPRWPRSGLGPVARVPDSSRCPPGNRAPRAGRSSTCRPARRPGASRHRLLPT